MYAVRFVLQGLPKTTNAQKGRAWFAIKKEKDHWLRLVEFALARRLPDKPLARARISYTRHSSVKPDWDGLVASFKCVQDSLVTAGVIENDRAVNIGRPEYYHEKTKPGVKYITVTVEEMRPDETHRY